MKASWNHEPVRGFPGPRAAVIAAATAVAVAGWLVSAGPVRAQLGATPAEMAKIYGPVFRHNARIWHRQLYENSLVDGDIYQKGSLFVRAVFRQGRAVLLEFSGSTPRGNPRKSMPCCGATRRVRTGRWARTAPGKRSSIAGSTTWRLPNGRSGRTGVCW